MAYTPTIATYIFILLFSFFYISYILIALLKKHIDLYDALILSTLVTFPLCIVLFPEVSIWFSQLTGTSYPFISLFGSLHFITFIMLLRLMMVTHKLNEKCNILAQNLAINQEQSVNKNKTHK